MYYRRRSTKLLVLIFAWQRFLGKGFLKFCSGEELGWVQNYIYTRAFPSYWGSLVLETGV